MPRAQPAAKRQQGAANQRDTRHENGLVGPGKRVQRQKSNGHLNGHAKQQQDNLPPTPPLPATPPHANGHIRQQNSAGPAADKVSAEGLRRGSVSAYSESSSSDYSSMPAISVSQEENPRRIDVNAAKNPAVHRDIGNFNLALTVLRACPLFDTIAILIVLLQLPPTVLSLVHLLFATLTFVPPSTSPSSGLSFSDIFEATLGTPSMATIVVVDLVVLGIWVFLYGPLKDFALDLAQTVIALTLGGGTNGKEAGVNNVFVCFGIVAVTHWRNNKHTSLRALLSSSAGIMSSSDPGDPLEPISHTRNRNGTHGWIRSVLAIHIVAQGLVRYVRDWYVRSQRQSLSASLGDPEAGKELADANFDPAMSNTQNQDNDSSNSLPVSNTSINSKKKKKQSAQVRTRQPLWAALASTKIVMVKEYETSHTAAESAGTNATDINNLGNAPFSAEPDRIWINHVGTGEVSFSTSYFPTHTAESCEGKSMDSSGVDKSKPFFVRVNQSVWQLTRINPSTDPDESENLGRRWNGEISGLAAASSYECEFVSTVDGLVIFSTSIQTTPTKNSADTTPGLAPNPQVNGRPGSPKATLRTSIASSEAKLTDERNRQKRERKDQKAKVNAVRKELEKLIANLSNAGSSDERLEKRIQQAGAHMRQAEEALETLEKEIQTLAKVPTEDASRYSEAKSAFQSQREAHKKYHSEIQHSKQVADREVVALKSELAKIQEKRDRCTARIAKLNAEHERIVEANAKGLNEIQRKDKERIDNAKAREKMERDLLDRLSHLDIDINTTAQALQSLFNAIILLEHPEMSVNGSPSTSAANLNAAAQPFNADPNAYGWQGQNTANPYATGQYVASAPAPRTRGRSSSMLSQLSGFTQSDEEGSSGPFFPQQQGNVWGEDTGNGNFGNAAGSRSGSGSGSAGDPKSPVGYGKSAPSMW
ncbi:putative ubiquitination network signaling protein acrB [Lachnellula suecica]|uniref:Putative ubiquitination network signaling protein acrB n=1 Tax=Lachnellula suecica TaxID=602035 RepID=A0A8T9CB14_9HELO|nr:putative ubiquitination network signaling protein acrB [Lachnellula suecica]